ncbi:chromosome partition protein Smc [Arthrobacter sp. Hiyo4]|nr:chromosome partition protein Smc [Arthrobacter sp. Hiyo4]
MHVIVGQGQLDKVLHATPEDRRGFIEEAAGILKHRRRKEKTVRKLEAMQANLQRLSDLTGEIRRQLTPLGKQADVARRAQRVQFDVRDARARLLADDLVQQQSSLEQDVADETALKARRAVVEQQLEEGRRQQAAVEQLAAEATPKLNAARDTWYRLSASRERLRSLGSLAQERGRLLGAVDAEPYSGRDPEQLERQAVRVRDELTELERHILDRRSALDSATAAKAGPNSRRLPRKKGSLPSCGPQPTGARAWRNLPEPLVRQDRGLNQRRPNWAGCGNHSPPARNAAAGPSRSSPPSKPRWRGSRRGRKASTPTTRAPAQSSTPSSRRLPI